MHSTLRLILLGIGLFSAVLARGLYRYMQRRGRDTLIDLGFNTPRVVHHFHLFYVGILVLLAGFVLYTVGGVAESHLLIQVAEALVVTFFLFPVTALYLWWRRVS